MVKRQARIRRAGFLAGVMLLATACGGTAERDPAFAPARPLPPPSAQYHTGSIYQTGRSMALFEDVRARNVGDMLTIRLVESTSASKSASTTTTKENSVDIKAPNLLGSAVQFNAPGILPLASNQNNDLSASLESAQKFTGEGGSSQGNNLTGNITVTVVDVLSNGNLVVRGEKILHLNQGDEFLRVAGIVRSSDIRPDNSILSTQLADAQISYGGSGVMDDSNRHGWLARFFNAWWPF